VSLTFFATVRGVEVVVVVDRFEEDTSVGLTLGAEGISVTTLVTGEALELTEAEEDALNTLACEHYRSQAESWYYDGL